jgi:hypothetical protein
VDMLPLPHPVEGFLQGTRFRLTRKLPTRRPTQVWPALEEASVILRPFSPQFGNLSIYEMMLLCATAAATTARALFEFGTFNGLTTWHLAANTASEARIWTLDLPLDHPARSSERHDRTVGRIHGIAVGGYFAGTPEASKIEQVLVDSLDFDPSPYRQKIDLCLIDASHEYEHVKRDTENALVMTRPGGAIFWHDYSRWWPGVQRCLDELSNRIPVFRIAGTALGAVRMPETR